MFAHKLYYDLLDLKYFIVFFRILSSKWFINALKENNAP